ncbi:MAG: hypothetical protein J5706_02245 [Elusimicrobiales bacterium]|nr:hypothetical protein [Elusimicrobiales bacterium]
MMKDSFSWRINRQIIRCPRIICQLYEIGRMAWHRIMPQEKTPCWHYFHGRAEDGGKAARHSLPEKAADSLQWFSISRPCLIHEHICFDIDSAIKAYPGLKGIAFIFFMGAGDYLYATPLFPALKAKYPRLDFIALAGDKNDRNNSALVSRLLRHNPCFSSVKTYSGGRRHPVVWKNYDYRRALEQIPPDYLSVPVYYDYSAKVPHRVISLFDTYCLPLPERTENTDKMPDYSKIPPPIMYFGGDKSSYVKDYIEEIKDLCRKNGKNDIVFLQLDSRGSNYSYPYIKELAERLAVDHAVISVTKGIEDIPGCLVLDIKKLEMNDTFRLLSELKKSFPVRVIAVNSVFWAASAGLGLPNLGLQHWHDPKLHNLWYPNITFLTDIIYDKIPAEYQIKAAHQDYRRHNKKIIDFLPEYIYGKFKDFSRKMPG